MSELKKIKHVYMGQFTIYYLLTIMHFLFHHSAVTLIEDDVCLELAGNKPATIAACNEGKICPIFFTGKWSACNKLCGEGKQTRQVICHRKENGTITIMDDDECTDEKPAQEQECINNPCEGVEYVESSWSGVS